jgi:hypothetical protein
VQGDDDAGESLLAERNDDAPADDRHNPVEAISKVRLERNGKGDIAEVRH